MLNNYFKVALRNIRKESFYSFLNILGLGIGIAATLMIYLYVKSELSYDQFHKDIDKMYTVTLQGRINEQDLDVAVTCPPMAEALTNDFSKIASSIRIQTLEDEVVRFGDVVFTEDEVIMADSNFFDFFSFNLIQGDPKTALVEPHSLVLTERMAEKYFGDESPLDKLMTLGRFNSTYKVTGIVEEAPDNSHLKFDIIMSASSSEYLRTSTVWLNNNIYTYFKVHDKDVSQEKIADNLSQLVTKYVGPEIEQFMGVTMEEMGQSGAAYGYSAFPVKDIHLHMKSDAKISPGGDITYVYIFSAIAALIIVIACINFMNLATARSSGRAKEVGLRKTLGSVRSTLIGQFLTESFIYSLVATILGIVAVIICIPYFNILAGKSLTFTEMLNAEFILAVIGIIILIGFLAGSYPAFYLTSFEPAEVLKGKVREGMKSGFIRSSLVVVQFFISTFLIICTAVVFSQLQYFRDQDMGMDKENIIVVNNAGRLQNNIQTFKQQLQDLPQTEKVSFTTNSFPGVNNTTVFKNPRTSKDHIVGNYFADVDHLETLGLEIIEGRFFSKDFPSDSTAAILNEAAVREFGYSDPLAEQVQSLNQETPLNLNIVGVVKDFSFEGLQTRVRPLVIQLSPEAQNLLIRYTGDPRSALNEVKETYTKLAPGEPFEYEFMDESFDAIFRAEERMGQVFTVFTGFAIFIACLGLVGLSAYTAQKRIKEIGVRKVMGATESSIVFLLNKEFTILVIIAFVIASPVAYYAMNRWLDNFANRIDLSWAFFALAAGVTLMVAWLTVSFQSFKAARANPVNSLKSE